MYMDFVTEDGRAIEVLPVDTYEASWGTYYVFEDKDGKQYYGENYDGAILCEGNKNDLVKLIDEADEEYYRTLDEENRKKGL